MKAAREDRCWATWMGLSHRSPRERDVGAALHENRCAEVWGSESHSGQISVGDIPTACR